MKEKLKKSLILFLCMVYLGTNLMTVYAENISVISDAEISSQNDEVEVDDTVETEEENQITESDLEEEETQTTESDLEEEETQTTESDLEEEETQTTESDLEEEETQTIESDLEENKDQEAENTESEEVKIPVLKIQAHVRNIGWMDWVESGELAGTTGKALSIEALKIVIEDSIYEGNIEYRVHVRNIGWMNWVKNGEIAGTTGRALSIEAIQIRFTGELAEKIGLEYATHVSDIGWLDTVTTGEFSGSEGYAKSVECLKVEIMQLAEITESTGNGFVKKCSSAVLTYSGHVQNIGDMKSVTNGTVLGTTGRGLQMEGLIIRLNEDELGISGDIKYRAHVQDYGWMDWVTNGQFVGTRGEYKQIEALQIELTGDVSEKYDIFYRVHVENIGWLGWAKNGEMAGTSGAAYQVEAVQILIQQKTAPVPGKTSDHYREGKNGWYYEGGYKFYYRLGEKVTDVRSIIGAQSSYEIKINKQMSCVTVYAKDGNNGYIIPVVAFACSPGSGTPTGTFYTSDKYRWHQLYGAMGQWCTRITGHILFHSPPYTSYNNKTLWPAEYNKLGTWASQGCVRLRSGDAKWIYDNCVSKTKVTIYNSSTAGPLGKPTYAKIPLSQTWDPTDPTV